MKKKIVAFELNKDELLILIVVIVNILCHIALNVFKAYYDYIPYVNLLLYIYLIFRSGFSMIGLKNIIILFFTFFYAITVSFFNGNSVGAIIAYAELFLIIELLGKRDISEDGWKMILIACLMVVVKYLFGISSHYSDWLGNMDSILNPNTISFIYYFSFIVISYWISKKYMFNKKLIFIFWLLMEYCFYKLNCRTYLVSAFLVGVFMLFIPKRFLDKKRRIIALFLIIYISGVIFPYIYSSLANNIDLSRWVYKYTHKFLFTGRELTWANFYDYEFSHKLEFIFGTGSGKERLFNKRFSLHNSYLGIIMNFGIIGYLLYIFYSIKFLSRIFESKDSLETSRYVLILGYIGFLIASFSEVVLQTPASAFLVGLIFASTNQSTDIMEK